MPINSNHKVSVIIPTFNRAELIGDSIRSALAQTYANLEVVVVDDGSDDDTEQVIATIIDPRLRYVRQPNRGRSNARNHALSLATGYYVSFLDSDDLYLPEKIERQVEYLQSHPWTGMVYTSAQCIDQQGNLLEHKYQATVSGLIYCEIAFFLPVTITLPTVMTYRRIFDYVGGFDEEMYRFEDTDMWRRISKICRIDAIPDVTCLLRTHDDNTLINQDPEKIVFALNYYAKKIAIEDDHINLDVRRRGLAGLYRYYGYALCSVPSFVDHGAGLLRQASEFEDARSIPMLEEECGLAVCHGGAPKSTLRRFRDAFLTTVKRRAGFRFAYRRVRAVASRIYREFKQRLAKYS